MPFSGSTGRDNDVETVIASRDAGPSFYVSIFIYNRTHRFDIDLLAGCSTYIHSCLLA